MARWIVEKVRDRWGAEIKRAYCSNCNKEALLKRVYDMDGTALIHALSKYCPNCGESMENDDNRTWY